MAVSMRLTRDFDVDIEPDEQGNRRFVAYRKDTTYESVDAEHAKAIEAAKAGERVTKTEAKAETAKAAKADASGQA